MKVKGRPGEVRSEEYAREVAARLTDRLAETLAQADEDTELPPPEDFAESVGSLVVWLPRERRNELADLLGPFWTGTRVRDALGVPTRQALSSRRNKGSILGLKSTDGDVLYPVAQFQRRPDGQVEVKPGLVPLFRALRGFDPWAVGVLLHTPAPELGGLTPLDWLRQGKDAAVLADLGRVVAREWSAGAA